MTSAIATLLSSASAARDNLPEAWIYVPQGSCKKITGGTLTPPK